MNRREALAALVALPAVVNVQAVDRTQLRPSSVVVLTLQGKVSAEGIHHMRQLLRQAFPNHHVVVLSDGTTLSIVDV